MFTFNYLPPTQNLDNENTYQPIKRGYGFYDVAALCNTGTGIN
jgi:hypothetical protein